MHRSKNETEPVPAHVKPAWVYTAILLVSAVLALNPITYGFVATEDWWPRRLGQLYLAFLDLYLMLVAVLAAIYGLRGGAFARIAFKSLLVIFIPISFGVELALNHYKHLTVLKEYREEADNSNVIVHRPDDLAGWSLAENFKGNHKGSDGRLVTVEIDERGGRKIELYKETDQKLFFFGDSILFGAGVGNHETALYLLSERLRGTFNVLNYAVSGYGLEQMYARLLLKTDEIKEGDVVVFAPYSGDLERNLISKRLPCNQFFFAPPASGFRYYPVFESGRLTKSELASECNYLIDFLLLRSTLPAGHLYRWIRQRNLTQRLSQNANAIFEAAEKHVRSHGAEFAVIFVAVGPECLAGRHRIDLSDLRTEYRSLIGFCPSDHQEVRQLIHEDEFHWSRAGHRWGAEALEETLRSMRIVDAAPVLQ